jgi:hypothetical protein
VAKVIQAALECSLTLAPREPGLNYDELLEIGRRLNFKDGEMHDVLRNAQNWDEGRRRLLPEKGTYDLFVFREEPDYRNFRALDLVLSELNERMREVGGMSAQLDRDVFIEHAAARGISRLAADAAVTVLVWAGQLTDTNGVIRSTHGVAYKPLPSEQQNQPGFNRTYARPERGQTYPIVKDVVERRRDGRPKHAEPLDAFGEALDGLGYGKFRLWWTQTLRELRQCEPQATPVAVCVLAAALVEGALTFVVRYARSIDAPVFRSKDFDRDPKTWRIDDLIASSASGGNEAILPPQARARADELIRTRQRIHAGRVLSDYPAAPPDLRPDEARDAKATADVVVRSILDWLERNLAHR